MLQLHHAERADALVAPLAAVLAEPPADPFAEDIVAVPTRGVERWLAQRLSHHLGAGPAEAGICARVSFGSPSRLVADILAVVLGRDTEDDPWGTEQLTWPLLEVIDDCAGEPWCAGLGRHLGVTDTAADSELRRGRRLTVARRLARLFASYALQRPAMLRDWLAGRDEDGAGRPVPADLAWQPLLWRRLRDRLVVPSPAERLEDAARLLVAEPGRVDLPARLSVFGPTRLPEDQLRVLHALSRHRDVHLWLPHPSPALWAKVRATAPTSPRRGDYAGPAAHPLLASMARDATELQLRLSALEDVADRHHTAPPPAPTLLGALQQRLRDDEPAGEPHCIEAGDRSVQVHACHGRSRQVEVLREVLVGLFADDPSLEPRDVLVMCPDIEAVAPLVAATFGLASDAEPGQAVHPGQTLRVRLADRSLRQTNPLLSLLGSLLDLADGRVTASEVLDLAAAEPVRRRFGFDDDDLDRIRQWATDGGVHWGEDAARRARFGLPDLRQGTWDTALDRLLLGAAMADEEQRFLGSALPLDDVDSTDIELTGRLAELVDRLTAVLTSLEGAHPLGTWLDNLEDALDRLAETGRAEGWQGVQARQVLADVRLSGAAYEDVPLRLPDVRALLAGRLQGRPTRAGFRTGALTVCSLEPMRAVPHRVVCLLGLDDGVFPRARAMDGDDVLLRDPCLGERDGRSEDRQLFLDAVTSASEHLIVLYSGADERTGATRPPAVPVAELLDALDRAGTTGDGRPAREQVVVRQPLQSVDERNFTRGALGRPEPFSFDVHAYRGALAGRGARTGPTAFLDQPLPGEQDGAEVDLDDLVAMLEHPVRWFLRRRLQVSLSGDTEDVEDRLPLELDGLQSWEVGDRLLAACLAGFDRPRALGAEWRRGEVPPKQLGLATLTKIESEVVPVAAAARSYMAESAHSIDVRAELPSGVVLTGTVPGVHGHLALRTTYSRLGPKHRLRAWVQLLALTVSDPDGAWRAATVGRGQSKQPGARIARLHPPSPVEAADYLDELLALREYALREPLPMPVGVACRYATSRYAGDSEVQALASAAKEWDNGFEKDDEHHVLCWGPASLSDILGSPTATEQAWWPQDRSRLGVLARRVWQPLLEHEETETA